MHILRFFFLEKISTGIGEELSYSYARDKRSLVLIARNMGNTNNIYVNFKKKPHFTQSRYFFYRAFGESSRRMQKPWIA